MAISKMVNYSIVHDLKELKRQRLTWLIQSLRNAIGRLPRCPHNNERIAHIERMKRELSDV